MLPDPFEQMQKAVDIVNTSLHPENKIAATLCGDGKNYFSLSYTNYWPEPISHHIGKDTRIGNSSGTVHAETACILSAPHSAGASLFITDPFCPNCAKNIAEGGIKTIYIDHKGFNKDFAERRGHHFESMSMRICEKAGITVNEIRRKEREIIPILEVAPDYVPADESPVEMDDIGSADEDTFRELIADKKKEHRGRRIAVAIARDSRARAWGLTARAHPAIGYSLQRDAQEMEHPQDGKYSFMLEPVNRLLMNAPRRGMKLIDGLIYSSGVPTAREQVNVVGAGFKNLFIGDLLKARDEDAFNAMNLLTKHGIVAFHRF